jgi:hypothetical protein
VIASVAELSLPSTLDVYGHMMGGADEGSKGNGRLAQVVAIPPLFTASPLKNNHNREHDAGKNKRA